ncbi:MAG: hypothetical protein ACK4FJ_18485 [Ferrovibrio sp.]|uniref:hypothetical protein n=1 Tax=Ferrovibrio sp. TaxID=1917215 RepID=UPI00391C4883
MRMPAELTKIVLAAACAKAEKEGASRNTILAIMKLSYGLAMADAMTELHEAVERVERGEQAEAAAVH